jgi:cell volume regulation protein A
VSWTGGVAMVLISSLTADTDLLLVILGGVILIGFLAEVIFYRYRLPENLGLMLVGILIGPVAHIINPFQVEILRGLAPFFGAVALSVIVLGGSLSLNFSSFSGGGRGVLMATLDTLLSIAFVTPLFHFLFGWPVLISALLGAMLGETTATIVIPVSQRLGLSQGALNSMVIDSTFNSVTCIVAFYILFDVLVQQGAGGSMLTLSAVTKYLLELVSTGVFIGAATGILWISVLERLGDISHSYIVTVAVAIALYALVDTLGGSAVLAVLVFGLVLANHALLFGILGKQSRVNLGELTTFKDEITFFVRTFFYVYVGVLVSLSAQAALVGAMLALFLLVPRILAVEISVKGSEELSANRRLLVSLYPRGLTVAVLAGTLIASVPQGSQLFQYASGIFDYSFMTILLTSAISAVLVAREYRRRTNEDLYELIRRLRKERQRLEKW